MKLRFTPYTLTFKHPFTLATGTRNTTPIVITEIEQDGLTGYGEASMPPYLGESHQSVTQFLMKASNVLSRHHHLLDMEIILKEVDAIEKGNAAAKASVDIALHDLKGKLINKPCYEFWNIDQHKTLYTSYTIGIDSPETMEKKVKEAAEYKILKVKLGKGNDKKIIETIRSLTDKTITVDVNQGWTDKYFVLDMIHWLKEKNVLFVEQPMPKERIEEMNWVYEKSPLPVIADESVQRFPDLEKMKDVFHGINIKLMKCTGMHEAYQMIQRARELKLKILIGCMSETSCAVSAAAQLTPLADWADLDGPLLIKNDLFEGVNFVNGKITLNNFPGIGVKKIGREF